MKKQITFDQRIHQLKTDLQRTADAHGKLLDDLRPNEPHQWTYEGMMEPGGDSIEVRARINIMVRPPLALDD